MKKKSSQNGTKPKAAARTNGPLLRRNLPKAIPHKWTSREAGHRLNGKHSTSVASGVPECPEEIRNLRQFVVWRLEDVKGRPKPSKIPYDPHTGKRAKANDPKTWGTYDEASLAYLYSRGNGGRPYDGIGFEFTRPWIGVDIDNCVDPKTGLLKDWAMPIVEQLKTYTELSPSGTGVHLFLKGEIPVDGINKPYGGESGTEGRVEIYTARHFFTLTGNRVAWWGRSRKRIRLREVEINKLYEELTTGNPNAKRVENPNADAPAQEFVQFKLSDTEVISLLQQVTYQRRLWEGNYSAYADEASPEGNRSLADFALVAALCFYTGDDTQVERLWKESGLYRDKLDREDYVRRTIQQARKEQTEYYSPGGAQTADGFNLTDVGNSDRMVSQNDGEILFNYSTKEWFVWDEQRWQPDTGHLMESRVRRMIRGLYAEARDTEGAQRQHELIRWAKTSEGEKHFFAVPRLAQHMRPADSSIFDSDKLLLNVRNGTLDLRTGALGPFKKSDFISRIAAVEYDPGAEAPLFQAFLHRIFNGNRELINYLRRAFGYSLTGSTDEQCLFMCWGEGSNGKTTLLELFMDLMGDYQTKALTNTLTVHSRYSGGASTDIAKLHRARYTYASESGENDRLAEDEIKRLTGTETISARFLYKDNFDFRPEFKLWICTNHKPQIFGTDNAIWRRIHLVPFTVVIPQEEQDKRLPWKLREEMPGILRWAVEGCREWQQYGLMPPNEVLMAVQDYRDEMDTLAEWIEEFCETGINLKERASDLYANYKEWADMRRERPMSTRNFISKLVGRGFHRIRYGDGGQRWIQGLQLRPYTGGLKSGPDVPETVH